MSYRKSNIAQLPVLEEVGLAEPAAEAIIEPPVSELLESPELPPVTRKLRNRIGSRNNNSRTGVPELYDTLKVEAEFLKRSSF